MSEPRHAALAFLDTCRARVDAELDRQLTAQGASDRLQSAMRYSVLGGGKRIRPALCLAAAEAVGVTAEIALRPACALELIHAYSLIHDDLPAMDNDDLRRGRPTVHIAYDEATAILAGDALQTLAFELLAGADRPAPTQRIALIQELAAASGPQGMVGGQAIDLASVGKPLSLAELEKMHRHKTGALICASVRLGALCAPDLADHDLSGLTAYARAIGLAFQVQDDLLDIEGQTDVIGKPQGSDQARAKPTYPALLGVEGAHQHLRDLLAAAREGLAGFGPEADPLRAMADYVVTRTH